MDSPQFVPTAEMLAEAIEAGGLLKHARDTLTRFETQALDMERRLRSANPKRLTTRQVEELFKLTADALTPLIESGRYVRRFVELLEKDISPQQADVESDATSSVADSH